MNLILRRSSFTSAGIFGALFDEQGNLLFRTLEHAYPAPKGFLPKVPIGEYICTRGMHRLEGMVKDFETFEIENVPGHSDILFHTGNVNADSAGCVLLGNVIANTRLLESRKAFDKFISLTTGLATFNLTVKGDT